MTSSGPRIDCKVKGHTAILTICSPGRKNAFTQQMYHELNQNLRDAESNPEVRYIVIRGNGDSFSAGNDVQDLKRLGVEVPPENFASRDIPGVDSVFTFLEITKPIIASVAGPAVGWGATMLLLCDFIVVADTAKIMFVFAKLGLVPEAGSTFLLAQSIGRHRAKNILMRGGTISADQAIQYGLAVEQTSVENLYERTLEFVDELDEVPYRSQMLIKKLIHSEFNSIEERAMSEFRALGELLKQRATQ